MDQAQRKLLHLLANNRKWAERIKTESPEFFAQLAAQQSPRYLWIGCSDSRVPANTIIGLMPGEVFVHRNVGNVVVHTDLNCLSVLQYAVDVLKIEHVIICGHYGCGGVRAALETQQHGLIDNWIRHIRDVYEEHRDEIEAVPDFDRRVDRLCEYNVKEQFEHVCQTTIVQDALRRGQKLAIHGWIYSIDDGLIRDLNLCCSSLDQVDSIFH